MQKYYEYNKLGLSAKDIQNILDNPKTAMDQPSVSMKGPEDYSGMLYGSISIYEF